MENKNLTKKQIIIGLLSPLLLFAIIGGMMWYGENNPAARRAREEQQIEQQARLEEQRIAQEIEAEERRIIQEEEAEAERIVREAEREAERLEREEQQRLEEERLARTSFFEENPRVPDFASTYGIEPISVVGGGSLVRYTYRNEDFNSLSMEINFVDFLSENGFSHNENFLLSKVDFVEWVKGDTKIHFSSSLEAADKIIIIETLEYELMRWYNAPENNIKVHISEAEHLEHAGHYVIRGSIENIGIAPIINTVLRVVFKDIRGNVIDTTSPSGTSLLLYPGEQTKWTATVTFDSRIASYGVQIVSFSWA
jgi:hypothetical protein